MAEKVTRLCRIGGNISKHSVIYLKNNHEVTVGRNPNATICILSTMISRNHALFKQRSDGIWTVTDQNSTNGVLVNDKKLHPWKEEALHNGDTVQLGLQNENNPDLLLYTFNTGNKENVCPTLLKRNNSTLECPQIKRLKCNAQKGSSPLSTQTETSIILLQQLKEQEEKMAQKMLQAEQKVEEMKQRLHDKESTEYVLRKEMEEKENEMKAAFEQERVKLNVEKELLEQKLRDNWTIELKSREEALFDQLKNVKEQLLEDKIKVEKELQEEMARKLEEKDKEIEEKLLAEKNKLEKIINTKELEQKLLEKQLEATQADNVQQQQEMIHTREQILNNMTDLIELELQCSICSELFVQATTLNCSHSFCVTCISEWMKRKRECPICRNTVTNMSKSIVLDSYIEKMVELLNDDMKLKRKELVEERKKVEINIAAFNLPTQKQSSAPTIVIDDNSDLSSGDLDNYNSDISEEERDFGAYYGGYGRCFTCGRRGHWSSGCPY